MIVSSSHARLRRQRLAQDLHLGVFTSALVTDVVDKTVWTIPALAILAPAVRQAMTDLQPGPRLPENASFYVGAYFDGSVTVRSLSLLPLALSGKRIGGLFVVACVLLKNRLFISSLFTGIHCTFRT